MINEDLKTCDYAVFLLHDRWGSPTGDGHTSGFAEEWELAQSLYKEGKLFNILLLFKSVTDAHAKDAGPQLTQVLKFKQQIESGKKYLFKLYNDIVSFSEAMNNALAEWLRKQEHSSDPSSEAAYTVSQVITPPSTPSMASVPDFDYFMTAARSQVQAAIPDYPVVRYLADEAAGKARSDIEWAQAKTLAGEAHFQQGALPAAIATFKEISSRLSDAKDTVSRYNYAIVVFYAAAALSSLGHYQDAVEQYDLLLERAAPETDLSVLEWIAKTYFNKAYDLILAGRLAEALPVFDDMLTRFRSSTELSLQEPLAKVLCNKGVTLGKLDRHAEAIEAYDEVLHRFSNSMDTPVRVAVAQSLFNKGVTLGQIGQFERALSAYGDLVADFGSDTDLALRVQVAEALRNKGLALVMRGKVEAGILAYDDMIRRFHAATELPLRERVASILLYKASACHSLNRVNDAIAAYNEVRSRFGQASEPSLKKFVKESIEWETYYSRELKSPNPDRTV